MTAIPRCSCCDGKATRIWQIGPGRSDDDSYLSCDVCLNEVCGGCCDVDDDGGAECIDCMQTTAIRAANR